MSSWVAPSIAAELWQKSLDDVLRCIREGAIPVRNEGDFTFVDIAPSPGSEISIPRDLRPPTFVAVTEDERAALLDSRSDAEMNIMATDAAADVESDTISLQSARAATAALRRRPLAA